MKKFIVVLALLGSPLLAQESKLTPPTRPLNLNPIPHSPMNEKSKSLPKIHLMSELCEIGRERYVTHGKDDEERCKARGGTLRVATESDDKFLDIKFAPTPPAPNRLQPGADPNADKVEHNIHHNPVGP